MAYMRKGLNEGHTIQDLNHGMIWCDLWGQFAALLSCPGCEKFPCKQFSEYAINRIHNCPLFTREVGGLGPPRRKKLSYIAKLTDGTYKELPDLDPNNPDLELIRDVTEVYPIAKVLVPTVVLKPKARPERDDIVRRVEVKEKERAPTHKEVRDSITLPKKRKRRTREEINNDSDNTQSKKSEEAPKATRRRKKKGT